MFEIEEGGQAATDTKIWNPKQLGGSHKEYQLIGYSKSHDH